MGEIFLAVILINNLFPITLSCIKNTKWQSYKTSIYTEGAWHIQVIDIHATRCNGNERSEFLENGLNDNFPAQSWVICASVRKYVGGKKKRFVFIYLFCLHFFHENEFHIVSQDFRHWSVNYLSANFCKPYKGSYHWGRLCVV